MTPTAASRVKAVLSNQKAATTPPMARGSDRNTWAAPHIESNTSATASTTNTTPMANTR